MQYLVIALIAIAVIVLVLVGGPILEDIFDGQVWLKANLQRERTTQFYAFLGVMAALILALSAGGLLAYFSHQRHQENIALIAANRPAPQLPRQVNIYIGPGQSKRSAYSRALDAGLILETDEVCYIDTRGDQERGLVTYDTRG